MRLLFAGVTCLAFMASAQAQGAGSLQDCLPQREMQDVVSRSAVVAPAAAVVTARRAVPNSDVLRASLCRRANTLVYVIVALRRDGRVVQVTVDAPSGRVQSVQ